MARKKKHAGIEILKARYGLGFISPWIIGMVLFFITPIFQSIYFSFASLSITADGVETKFEGIKNYYNILVTDPNYMDNLLEAFSSLFVSMPFILVVSMVLALLLNGEYKGRIFFRGLYFLPVILASGIVLDLFLKAGDTSATEATVSTTVSFGMIDFEQILKGLNLPSAIEGYLTTALGNIFLLVWQSGIQTILIIAGLQSIPDLLYEVAKVEGCTKWQEFWYITLPMLMRTMILVIIFTIIELVSSNTNIIVSAGYNRFNSLEYGIGSAMLWFYFAIVGVFIALLFVIYQKVFVKKWG